MAPGFQRADGVFGPLIVRQSASQEPHANLYEHDLPEHVIMVSDWLGELGVSKFVAHHHDSGDNKPPSMIVNGRGRHPGNISSDIPLTRFTVKQVYYMI